MIPTQPLIKRIPPTFWHLPTPLLLPHIRFEFSNILRLFKNEMNKNNSQSMILSRKRDEVSQPSQNMWYYCSVYFYLSTVDAKDWTVRYRQDAHGYTFRKEESFSNCWTSRKHTSHVTSMWLKTDGFTSYSLPRDAYTGAVAGSGGSVRFLQ